VPKSILHNARIFDGTGSDAFRGFVVIDDDRIVDVGHDQDPRALRVDADLLYDCSGSTLMPGMVEAHAHITWPSSTERRVAGFKLPVEETMLHSARNARVLLEAGFTSAYSAGALGDRIEVVLRDEIAGGWLPGPRLSASTIERSAGAEGGYVGAEGDERLRGPEALRGFIEHCAKLGVDSVKLLLSGEDALLAGSSQHVLYTDAEVAAAVETANRLGVRLAAHTQAAESIKMALRNGIRVLYHCSWADDEALDMLEELRSEVFVAPAIGVIVAAIEAPLNPHFDMSVMKAGAPPVIEATRQLIPELVRRGVRVLPGGDYGFAFNPNGRNARDLQHFVDLFGFTPSEALRAATMFGGQLMGRGDELGLVRPGYLADLLLVKGDPTLDVSILQDTSNLQMIMQGGRVHKAPSGFSFAAAA
jgi:imidazolonepropionase-like amidohydrolase